MKIAEQDQEKDPSGQSRPGKLSAINHGTISGQRVDPEIGSLAQILLKDAKIAYTKAKERDGVWQLPPSTGNLSPEEKRKAIIDYVTEAGPQELDKIFAAVAAQEAKPVAPALWADRSPGWNEATGQKASPALWIKMHYGNKDPDNFDAMGLTRADLSQLDPPLYNAYAQMISRAPEKALPALFSESRVRTDDPEEAIERHRKQAREAQARYRKNKII